MRDIIKNKGLTFRIALGIGINNRVTIIRNWSRIIGFIRICVRKGTHAITIVKKNRKEGNLRI